MMIDNIRSELPTDARNPYSRHYTNLLRQPKREFLITNKYIFDETIFVRSFHLVAQNSQKEPSKTVRSDSENF